MFGRFWQLVSHDIGIDLGTVNTLVAVRGKGIIIREPSVVAIHKKTKQVLAIGTEAKRMIGRTPQVIEAIRPLRDGVISDFDTTEAMLRHFIQKVHALPSRFPKIPRPRVVIGIPSGVTEVERRAVQDAAISAGAREAYLIEEPMADAIGSNMNIEDPEGNMVVDIGGGTTGVAVISLGGIVYCKSIKVAGDKFDEAIVNYVRRQFNLLIGERTAENIKMAIGNAYPFDEERVMEIKGRDLVAGAPKTIEITSTQVHDALTDSINEVVDAVKTALEKTPPELASDIVDNGIVLTGGGALLANLDVLLRERTGLPVSLAEDPLTCVVLGSGKVLEELDLLKQLTTD
jgi:rod shape-determining protein MreB